MDDRSGEELPGSAVEATRAPEEEHQNAAEGGSPTSDPGNLVETNAETVKSKKEIDFPRSVLKRLVKEKMKEFLTEESEDPNKEKRIQDAQISKEALMAFNEAAKLFIYYVTSTANDICRESKRQTISAEDVFRALGEIDFEEFVNPLRDSLQDFKEEKKGKKRKKEESGLQPAEDIEVQDKEQLLQDVNVPEDGMHGAKSDQDGLVE
eukprot:jgi/Picsp_1/1462/NSC_04941-R1_protein